MAQGPETSAVEHHITVAARPEVVFSYFTDPTKMVRWMGSEATLDPRPGGICRIVFRPSAARLEFVMTAYGIGEARPGGPNEARVMLGEFVEVDPYRRIALLAATLTRDELLTLGADTVLHRLFWEEPLRRFPTLAGDDGPRFACSCSRHRVGNMLRSLGRHEVDGIVAEQGRVEIGCDFCGLKYHFDPVDVGELFTPARDQPPGSSATH